MQMLQKTFFALSSNARARCWCHFSTYTKKTSAYVVLTFIQRFVDFGAQKTRFELLSNPFAADVECVPSNLQLKLIELQCSDTQKAKYESVGHWVSTFYPRHNVPAVLTGCLNTFSVWQHILVWTTVRFNEDKQNSKHLAMTSKYHRIENIFNYQCSVNITVFLFFIYRIFFFLSKWLLAVCL